MNRPENKPFDIAEVGLVAAPPESQQTTPEPPMQMPEVLEQLFNNRSDLLSKTVIDGRTCIATTRFSYGHRHGTEEGADEPQGRAIFYQEKAPGRGKKGQGPIYGQIRAKGAPKQEVVVDTENKTIRTVVTNEEYDEQTMEAMVTGLFPSLLRAGARKIACDFVKPIAVCAGVLFGAGVAYTAYDAVQYNREIVAQNKAKDAATTQFDKENYEIAVLPVKEGPRVTVSGLSQQATEKIPSYKPGDTLDSPRLVDLELDRFKCKTLSVPNALSKAILIASESENPHVYDIGFRVTKSNDTVRICQDEQPQTHDEVALTSLFVGIQAINLETISVVPRKPII